MAYIPLTDQDRHIIREMWTADHGLDEIAKRIHRNHGTVQYAADQMALGPKPRKDHDVWKPEVVEVLTKAWFDGGTGTGIAQMLQARFGVKITRMSVIGKVHRLGLKRSPEINRINCNLSSDGMGPARAMLKKKAVPKPRPAKVAPIKTAVANPKATYGANDNIREAWVIVTDAAWDILPGSEPKTLLNRRNFGECKFPVGLDEPEQRFCCIKTDQTYCMSHRALMYRPPTKGEKDALRGRGLLRMVRR